MIILAAFLLCPIALRAGGSGQAQNTGKDREKIRVLLLPKFEAGELEGDFPGEAQLYYEAYEQGAEEYEIAGGPSDSRLFVKDGVALFVTGSGKVNVTLGLSSILKDERFDFSDAYVMSVGCMGTPAERTVMGDVVVCTATVDYDLGHHADVRDMSEESETTWFHDDAYDDTASRILDPELMDKVYNLVKDTELKTTEKTRRFMLNSFNDAEWAGRDPIVMKGTVASGDNYWKGAYGEANARLITDCYGCPDPYSGTEMEDNALAVTMDRMGMLDRLIIIRVSVNIDVFMNGTSPESLWGDKVSLEEDEEETSDIFATGMENNFKVGSKVVDAILDGTISD